MVNVQLESLDDRILDWLGDNLDKIEGLHRTAAWEALDFSLQQAFDLSDTDAAMRRTFYDHIDKAIDGWDEHYSDVVHETYLTAFQAVNMADEPSHSIWHTITSTLDNMRNRVWDVVDTVGNIISNPLNLVLDKLNILLGEGDAMSNFLTNPWEWPAKAMGTMADGIVKGFAVIFDQFLNLADDVVEDSMVNMAKITARASKRIVEESKSWAGEG